jgi:hypothetical protein
MEQLAQIPGLEAEAQTRIAAAARSVRIPGGRDKPMPRRSKVITRYPRAASQVAKGA